MATAVSSSTSVNPDRVRMERWRLYRGGGASAARKGARPCGSRSRAKRRSRAGACPCSASTTPLRAGEVDPALARRAAGHAERQPSPRARCSAIRFSATPPPSKRRRSSSALPDPSPAARRLCKQSDCDDRDCDEDLQQRESTIAFTRSPVHRSSHEFRPAAIPRLSRAAATSVTSIANAAAGACGANSRRKAGATELSTRSAPIVMPGGKRARTQRSGSCMRTPRFALPCRRNR